MPASYFKAFGDRQSETAGHTTNGARCGACGLTGWPRPCRHDSCEGFEHVRRVYLEPGDWDPPSVDWRCDKCLASGHTTGVRS
jgi:hypothetical protein